jgi:hypothetical protein
MSKHARTDCCFCGPLALLLRTDKPRTQVTTAENGLEGLQLLQASVGGAPGAPPPPAFVLTDMQMCAVIFVDPACGC